MVSYLLFSTIISFANNEEGKGAIKGKVITTNGEPAASVTVLLKGTRRGAATDENGFFEFRNLKAGNYTVQISLTGHETQEETVVVNENVEGKRPNNSGANNTANAWISYKFPTTVLKGLGLGIGGNYSGKQYVSNTTTAVFTLPEFTTIDATAFYDLKNVRFSVKADNLTSEKYWAQSTLAPMPPARYSFSAAIQF